MLTIMMIRMLSVIDNDDHHDGINDGEPLGTFSSIHWVTLKRIRAYPMGTKMSRNSLNDTESSLQSRHVIVCRIQPLNRDLMLESWLCTTHDWVRNLNPIKALYSGSKCSLLTLLKKCQRNLWNFVCGYDWVAAWGHFPCWRRPQTCHL